MVWWYPAEHVVITNKRDHVLYETKRSYLNLDGVVLWGRGRDAYRLADKRTGRHTNRYAHWLVNRQIGKQAYRQICSLYTDIGYKRSDRF